MANRRVQVDRLCNGKWLQSIMVRHPRVPKVTGDRPDSVRERKLQQWIKLRQLRVALL